PPGARGPSGGPRGRRQPFPGGGLLHSGRRGDDTVPLGRGPEVRPAPPTGGRGRSTRPPLDRRPFTLPMVKVEDAVIARWETGGSRFEVLVDPQAVQDLKDGKKVDLSDKLALDQVFKDAKKGDKISEEHLEKTFHTRNLAEIARIIIQKGEVQVTTEQRHHLQATKRQQVVATIARNAMNPQTGAPHPATRIEAAMTEAKVHIDPFRPVDEQVQEVLAKLRPLIPIRLDVAKVRIKIPGQRRGEGPRTHPRGELARGRELERYRRDSRRNADRALRETQRALERRHRDRFG